MADPFTMLQNLGFEHILLWLLTFAVVFGVLSGAGEGIPKNKGTRGIIAIVIAFLVMMATPLTLIDFIGKMGSSLILIILGLIVFVIFIEAAGVKTIGAAPILDKDGQPTGKFQKAPMSIFEKYSAAFIIAFFIIAGLVFVASGGLEIMGITSPGFDIPETSMMTIGFLIVIVIAVMWLIADPKSN